MNNTTTNDSVPNTPNELVKNNTTTTPEEIWERYCDLGVKEKEVFILNTISQMKDFHMGVVEMMLKDDEYTKEDVGEWVQDGTKWCDIMRILTSMVN